MKTNSKIIVALHIGRGGHFNNPGHLFYLGEKNFQDLISQEYIHIFPMNKDDKGRFCKPFFVDGSGNVVSEDDPNGLIGTLDFDRQFDTDYCKYIEDCDERELTLMATTNEYKEPKIVAFLENFNTEWKFDNCGFLITD